MKHRGGAWIFPSALAGAALILIVVEAGMLVAPDERSRLFAVFAGSVLLAAVIGWALTRIHRRLPSLRWTILVVAVAAVVVAGGVVAASASAMFLTADDLRVVLAALLVGTGLGMTLALSIARPLTADLRSLADAASRVTDGDLTVRSGVRRGDEVGDLARSLDRMVDQLALLEGQRERGEAARRRLLTAIGHDLRTPLGSLQAAIEALEDGVAPDPARYLRSMSGDVDRLGSMIRDLFVLSRLESGAQHLEVLPMDLVELADGAIESVTPLAARSHIEVRLVADGPVAAVGDFQAIDRVLRNLLDNAIRHSPPRGVVEVAVGEEGGCATVRVRDQGPGFPDDFVAMAFDEFSRADPARERHGGGAGLGLAIARELVAAHGGSIWIEPSTGAELVFRLPVTPRRSPALDAPRITPRHRPRRR